MAFRLAGFRCGGQKARSILVKSHGCRLWQGTILLHGGVCGSSLHWDMFVRPTQIIYKRRVRVLDMQYTVTMSGHVVL